MTKPGRIASWLSPGHDDDPLVAHAVALTLRDVVRRFWPRLRPLRWWLALALLLLAVAPLIEIAEVMLYQRLVDDVLVPVSFAPLLWLGAVYIALNLVSGAVSGADDYLGTWIAQRFMVPLRRDLYAHVLSLPAHVHDRRRLGDDLSRITADVATLERFMVGQLVGAIGAIIRLVMLVGALVWLQWELALGAFVTVPALAWVSARFARHTKTVSRERRRRGGSLTAVTEEGLANASLVQLYGSERQSVASYHRQSTAIATAELAASKVRALFLPLVDLVELAGVLAVIGMGVWALGTERLTLGGLLAFLTLLMQCYQPIRQLANLVPELFAATAGIERVVELLDERPATDRPGARPLVVTDGEIRLEGVTVTYPGTVEPVVRDLDLHVPAGGAVAVVGSSGAGKSTLVKLLTRQIEPVAGRVLVDGQDLGAVTAESVRALVTVVPQETLLLDDSVRANLLLARPDASTEDVRSAARAADADSFITALPGGYDARIGQRGRLLSGGQRQRLALARALLRRSPILVLDEPTTGLDDAAAERFLVALAAARPGRTLVVATHDPRVLAHVDAVVEIERLVRDAVR